MQVNKIEISQAPSNQSEDIAVRGMLLLDGEEVASINEQDIYLGGASKEIAVGTTLASKLILEVFNNHFEHYLLVNGVVVGTISPGVQNWIQYEVDLPVDIVSNGNTGSSLIPVLGNDWKPWIIGGAVVAILVLLMRNWGKDKTQVGE